MFHYLLIYNVSMKHITQSQLQNALKYDANTGLFNWLKPTSNRVKANAPAGALRNNGYVVVGFNGNHYLAHRLAWFYSYGTWPKGEIDHITYLFRHIILDIGFVTIAVAVNLVAWHELIVGDLKGQFCTPVQLCFSKCIELMINRIRFRKPGEKVLVCVDQGMMRYLKDWSTLYKMQADRYPEIESIYFAPVPKVVALQGADMIAAETYQYAKECLKNGKDAKANAHFRDYLKRELSTGLLYDREHITEVVSRFRASSG